MIEAPVDPKLKKKLHNANRIIIFSLIGIFIVNFIVGVSLIILTVINGQQTIEAARQLHKRTQEYVKCVAEALVILPENRHKDDIELCTNQADNNTKEAQ